MDSAAKAAAARLEQERADYFRHMGYRGYDATFIRGDDEPLTDSEIAAVTAYWSKYSFAYPEIDYESFKTFKNRCGRFDVRHCPAAVKTYVFKKAFVNPGYGVGFQNKGMMEYLYPDFHKPRTLYRRLSGWFFDENFEPKTRQAVAEECSQYVATTGDLIVKISGTGGGKGIHFLNKQTGDVDSINALFKRFGSRPLVIQTLLEQSPFMAAFNPSSVNTIRITTLFWKGKATPLAALVRIGSFGSEVDNWCSGGSLLGIDIKTGKCNDWALANDLTHISRLSSGMDLTAQELVVPSFDEIKRLVCHAHCRNPYIKLISWDIALDRDNTPTFIECNFAGMIQIHEAVTGPVFGPFMDEICDELLLKKFHLPLVTKDFFCREYADHVVIDKYVGGRKRVTIPDSIQGKPVTMIAASAFKGQEGLKVTVSEKIAASSKRALASVEVAK